jgi:hypothetical protein
VRGRFNDVLAWLDDAGPGKGWNNLDSLDVGNGAMDGLTDVERQTTMTLWAIEAAPLYSGDDLTQLDDYGLQLLTNDEVIAIDQAGVPARPVAGHERADQEVWYARRPDGTYAVALFNLADTPATVTAKWSDLGIPGAAVARDVWSHTDLGTFATQFAADLPAHGSRLLVVQPGTETPGDAGGTVPATLSLTLGGPASFGSFTPGVAREYTATSTANVISTAGDATLSVSDPGHLTNGTFSLPQPLQVLGVPKTYAGPVSNDVVPLTFKQSIGATDALRTGTYATTLTFTLSTTAP